MIIVICVGIAVAIGLWFWFLEGHYFEDFIYVLFGGVAGLLVGFPYYAMRTALFF